MSGKKVMHEGVHLFVRDLRLAACVGASAQEREKPQQLVAQLNLITDTIAACHSDVLADTVDYAALTHHLAQEAGKKQTRLLEALAEQLVRLVRALNESMRNLTSNYVELSLVDSDTVRFSNY
ncbi:MAG: dihydroneopterin aldolase, partial [Myxococcota bacterium]